MRSFAGPFARLTFALLALAFAGAAAAQARPVPPAPKIERHRIRSEVLGQERELIVRTPPGYEDNASPYPVLYVTDGEVQVPLLSELVRYLARLGRMPELVIVGITHVDRTRELTPTRGSLPGAAMPFETSGGADAFLGFVEKEVVPFVEKRYRTAPLRILGGHSFGGLFALHALTERPGLFRAYVAASPTLTWDGELPLKRVQALLERRPDLAATVYYTVGDEGAALADAFRRFGEIAAKGGPRFRATGVHHPGEDHGTIVLDTFHRGFRALFEGWRMPVEAGAIGPKGGLAAVEAHYREISDRLGIVVAPPENTLNLAGYQALQDGRPDDAIATLRRCVEIYGTSPNAHDSLGEAYEKKGELALALASYERAAELGAKRGDPLTGTFRANLERAKRLVRDAKR